MARRGDQNGRGGMRHGRLPLPLAVLRAVPWAPLRAGLVTLGVAGVLAVEVTRAGLLPIVPQAFVPDDPVVTTVGRVPLRLSDLRAQAGAAEASAAELRADGTVATAADQLALALVAEREGLHEALEVRAELALARRAVLADAYLDLAVRRATDEARLRAAYEAEVSAAKGSSLIAVRRAHFASEEDARRAQGRIARGASFASAVRRAGRGASHVAPQGLVSPDALPPEIADRAQALAAGLVSDPFQTGAGWTVLRVEARRGVRVPPYEERRPVIAARLRAEALAEAARRAGVSPPSDDEDESEEGGARQNVAGGSPDAARDAAPNADEKAAM